MQSGTWSLLVRSLYCRVYDVEKTRNPQWTKDIADHAPNHILKMYFAKKIVSMLKYWWVIRFVACHVVSKRHLNMKGICVPEQKDNNTCTKIYSLVYYKIGCEREKEERVSGNCWDFLCAFCMRDWYMAGSKPRGHWPLCDSTQNGMTCLLCWLPNLWGWKPPSLHIVWIPIHSSFHLPVYTIHTAFLLLSFVSLKTQSASCFGNQLTSLSKVNM